VYRLGGTSVEGRGATVAAVDRLGGAVSREVGDGASKMTGWRPAQGHGVEGGWHGEALGLGGGGIDQAEMAQGGARRSSEV
jgi:hypothetical protein